MGPGEWHDAAARLTERGHEVLLDRGLTYDRGVVAAAGTQLARLRDAAFWAAHSVEHVDLAVGFEVGAGPAAAMVADGRATAAVLLDPDLTAFAMAHPDDLDVLAPKSAFELALETSERLRPFEDNLRRGPVTREMVDIVCGAFTGEPWRARQADLVAPFLVSGVVVDRALRPTEADLQAADWTSAAVAGPVTVWLSAGSEPIAEALRTRGVDATVTPWGQAPWLQSVEELVAALEGELRLRHARAPSPGRLRR